MTTEAILQASRSWHGGADGPMAAYVERTNALLLDVGAGRIAAMDAGGIDVQVLSVGGGSLSELEAAQSAELCEDANQKMANAVLSHPTRFAAFATLPVQDPDRAAQMMERWVGRGFKGALINGTVNGKFLDRPEFLPIFEAAEALDVPIYLHPAPPPQPVQQAYYADLKPPLNALMGTSAWGWHVETGLHALRLIASGLFDRLPALKTIVGHMGEDLPYSIARADTVLSHGLAGKRKRSVQECFVENFWVTNSGYFTLPPVQCAREVLRPGHLMLSVDYPYSRPEQGSHWIEELRTILPEDEVERIAGGNAAALLGL